MIRILNIEPEGYCDEARNILKNLGAIIEIPVSRSELIQKISEFDVLIVRLAH